jgi:hypothetical protein
MWTQKVEVEKFRQQRAAGLVQPLFSIKVLTNE